MNAQYVGDLTSRTRVYIIGINAYTNKIIKPLSEWADLLDTFARALPKRSVEDILLPDSHPLIVAGRSGLESNYFAQSSAAHDEANEGVGWELEYAKHCRARSDIKKKTGKIIPNVAELAKSDLCTGDLRFTSARPRGLVLMHKWAVRKLFNDVDSAQHFLWDAALGIEFAKFHKQADRDRGITCLRTNSRLYDTSSRRDRWLHGAELLYALGFSKTTDISGLTTRDLTGLAGNAISIRVLACLHALVTCTTRFEDVPPADARQQLLVSSTRAKLIEYVGPCNQFVQESNDDSMCLLYKKGKVSEEDSEGAGDGGAKRKLRRKKSSPEEDMASDWQYDLA